MINGIDGFQAVTLLHGCAPPHTLPRSACSVLDQRLDHRLDRPIRNRPHLVIRPILDRMLDVDGRRDRTERPRLRVRAVHELDRRDEYAGQAAGFEVHRVVHTARRAAASIGQRLDDRVACLRDLLA